MLVPTYELLVLETETALPSARFVPAALAETGAIATIRPTSSAARASTAVSGFRDLNLLLIFPDSPLIEFDVPRKRTERMRLLRRGKATTRTPPTVPVGG